MMCPCTMYCTEHGTNVCVCAFDCVFVWYEMELSPNVCACVIAMYVLSRSRFVVTEPKPVVYELN